MNKPFPSFLSLYSGNSFLFQENNSAFLKSYHIEIANFDYKFYKLDKALPIN